MFAVRSFLIKITLGSLIFSSLSAKMITFDSVAVRKKMVACKKTVLNKINDTSKIVAFVGLCVLFYKFFKKQSARSGEKDYGKKGKHKPKKDKPKNKKNKRNVQLIVDRQGDRFVVLIPRPHQRAFPVLPRQLPRRQPVQPVQPQQRPPVQPIQPQQQACGICLDEKAGRDFVRLQCGHSYCRDCLLEMVNFAIKEKRSTNLRCPNPDCKIDNKRRQISEYDIGNNIVRNDPKKLSKITKVLANERILKKPNARHCPTPNCPHVFEFKKPKKMTCPQCKKKYCPDCLINHSSKTSCKKAIKRAESKSDRKTRKWAKKNTKACPRCGNGIEKAGGCDWVGCRCGHGFCWNCGGNHHFCPLKKKINPVQVRPLVHL